MRTKYLIAIPLAALVMFGFSCNPFQAAKEKAEQKLSEGVAENLLGKATGGDVDINSDDGSVTFKGKDGDGTFSTGDNVKLPDDFPSQVPVYKDAKITSVSMSRKGNVGAWVSLTSNDDVSKIVSWYDDQAKSGNWTEDSSYSMNGVEMRGYSKDGDTLSVTISPEDSSNEDYKTSVLLVWSQEQVSE